MKNTARRLKNTKKWKGYLNNMDIKEKELVALMRVMRDDAKKFQNLGKEWQLGYESALERLESYLCIGKSK